MKCPFKKKKKKENYSINYLLIIIILKRTIKTGNQQFFMFVKTSIKFYFLTVKL